MNRRPNRTELFGIPYTNFPVRTRSPQRFAVPAVGHRVDRSLMQQGKAQRFPRVGFPQSRRAFLAPCHQHAAVRTEGGCPYFALMTQRLADRLQCFCLPELSTISRPSGQGLAVGAEGHGIDPTRWAELATGFARVGV